jgi:hypothetical protein
MEPNTSHPEILDYLLEAPIPMTEENQVPDETIAKTKPYRLTFGKHREELLQNIPPSYIAWLIRENIAADRPDLREALAGYDRLGRASSYSSYGG